ncbi:MULTISPECIES: DUF262 domain-containing protein [unclassified Rheinheimera]|uniref:DUF262 domain-containing protein n=1 Tax=unclassified Rheinheimera TaxID=115860 RepID=UPI0021F8BE79|nr:MULTISPECIES: DUF262 domain-containing protein [unclassified Rheinheimera]MDF3124745.1 DUF262 domain-containing protein [Rheinheimera sp. 1928-s]CAI3797456.1 hypothetical protein JAMGFMIE_01825 [Rheinheimera sp. MM224]
MPEEAENKTLDLYPIDYPFETLVSRITSNPPKTVLNPEFQRKYKWDKEGWGRASKFIESCLMRIPLPSCYFAEDENRKQLVIDGVQRLTTIAKFFNDEFALEGMTTFKDLEGKKFSELGDLQAELESTTIRCIVLRKENPKKLIREIFARLNQGAVQLSDQEIRHAIYPGRLDELLIELAATQEIIQFGIVEGSDKVRNDREPDEQVLRFFAFTDDLELTSYDGVLKDFLHDYMELHAEADEQTIVQLRNRFQTALHNCKLIFEENVFLDTTRDRPKQGMVHYDLLMATVGLLDSQTVENKKIEIKNAYDQLCASDEFRRTLSSGLQKKSSILRRRNLWRPLLDAAIS